MHRDLAAGGSGMMVIGLNHIQAAAADRDGSKNWSIQDRVRQSHPMTRSGAGGKPGGQYNEGEISS